MDPLQLSKETLIRDSLGRLSPHFLRNTGAALAISQSGFLQCFAPSTEAVADGTFRYLGPVLFEDRLR